MDPEKKEQTAANAALIAAIWFEWRIARGEKDPSVVLKDGKDLIPVTFTSTPDKADIFVKDVRRGKTQPAMILNRKYKYSARIERDGYESVTKALEFKMEDMSASVEVTLEKKK